MLRNSICSSIQINDSCETELFVYWFINYNDIFCFYLEIKHHRIQNNYRTLCFTGQYFIYTHTCLKKNEWKKKLVK